MNKTINLENFALLQMLICMLAFKDYNIICIISQLLGFFVIFLTKIKKKKYKIKVNSYAIYKMSFFMWGIFSVFWATNTEIVMSISKTLLLRMLCGLSIIMFNDSKEKLKLTLKYFVIAAFILCVRIVLVVPISSWGSQRIGNFLNHDINNSYGNTGITYVLSIVSCLLLLDYDLMKKKVHKLILILLFTFFSVLSGSKKAIILLLIAFFISNFLESENIKEKIINNLKLVFTFIFIFILIMKIPVLYNSIGHRFISFFNFFSSDAQVSSQSDLSTIGRYALLNEAISVFFHNPILGVGLGNFVYVNSFNIWAENNFMEILVDTGLVGFIIYYSLIFKIFVVSLLGCKGQSERSLLCKKLITILICFSFIDFTMVSYFNSTLQIFLAYIFAMYYVTKGMAKDKLLFKEKDKIY